MKKETKKENKKMKAKKAIKKKEIVLEVFEAFPSDVGYNRARIDHQTRLELDVSIGDTLLIKGTKNTDVVVWRAHPTDEGKKTIRIDERTRKNAGTKLGEKVEIRHTSTKEIEHIKSERKKVIHIKEEDKEGINSMLKAMGTVRNNIDCLIETMSRLENDFKFIHKRFWEELSKEYDLGEARNHRFNKLTYEITECGDD